jgi:hypothetical protein
MSESFQNRYYGAYQVSDSAEHPFNESLDESFGVTLSSSFHQVMDSPHHRNYSLIAAQSCSLKLSFYSSYCECC